jgi:hypothetical protein
MHCEVELVLDHLEETRGLGQRRHVVRRHREDLAHAQVHPPLAGADVADAVEQFVEVVARGFVADGRVLQPLVVHHETLDEVLAQVRGGPLAKLRAAG